jgi:cation-transporting P-type ATPase E
VLTLQYPLLPRHSTVVNALTIGVPAFFLALMPNTQLFRPGFLGRVLALTIPSGLTCGLAVMASYGLSLMGSRAAVQSGALSSAQATGEARITATITLFLAAWWVLVLVARPLNALRWAIVLAMAGAFVGVLVIPPISEFFALSLGPDRDGGIALGVGLLAMGLITLTRRVSETAWVRSLLAPR